MSTKFKKVNKLFLTSFIILISFSLIFINFLDKELFAGDVITVFIDPGHGGRDPGCVHNGLMEKEVNLKIALKLKSLLESNDFKVIMRRTSDQYMSLNDIANMANNSGADLFLSIHNNASLSPASLGTETYWCANGVQGSSQFAASIQSNLVSAIGRPNRGVKSAGFRVLKNTRITAALVECVFVSNSEEANLLKDDGFVDKIVKGLFNGISSYAKSITPKPPASGTNKATRVLVNIDEPANGQTISGTFELKGWAVEQSAIDSTGITAVHVYDGPAAGAKNLIGIATYGVARPDVADSFEKSNFINCGFLLPINCNTLSKGTHIIHVYAHNEHLGWDYSTVKINVVDDGSGTQVTQQTVDTSTQGSTNSVLTNNVSASEESSTDTNYTTSETKKVLINVDNPKNGQNVSGTFELAGWAVEQSAINSTGITTIHVYDGKAAGSKNMLGVATYGLPREDVSSYFGKSNLKNCGFKLIIDGSKLTSGAHTLYIYAYNQNLGWKYATIKINYTSNSSSANTNQNNNTSSNSNTSSTETTNSNTTYNSSGKLKTIINIDTPSANQQVSGTFELAGWAVENSALDSTGIKAIHVYNGPANGEQNMLGVAEYGIARSDVASSFGKSNFTNCGFKLNVNSSKLTDGKHTIYIYAYNPNIGWKYATVTINYVGGTSSGSTNSTGGETVITNSTNMVGYIDVSAEQLVRIFEIKGSSKVNWARRLAPLYIKWGQEFNIRADIAWAMMCHETGFLEFGGIARPEWNNFCGLGVVGPDGVGCRFDSEELGVIAHYAHLAWYVYPSHVNEYCSKTYDPRHSDSHYYNGNSTIGTLNGRWAPGSTYTYKIILFANQIYGN